MIGFEMHWGKDMESNKAAKSFVLPKRPLLRGIARLFDFTGSLELDQIEDIRVKYQNPPPVPSAEEAIRSTWLSVGDSMRWAIGEYEKELDEKNRE